MRKLLIFLFLLSGCAFAQNYNVNVGGIQYTSGPSVPGSCTPDGRWFFKNTSTTGWYQCSGGVYVATSGGPSTVGGLAIANAGATAPSPVGTSTCPGNASGWAQNGAGTYQTVFSTDPAARVFRWPTSPGFLTVCQPLWFNATGQSNPYFANGANINIWNDFTNASAGTYPVFSQQWKNFNSATDTGTYTAGNLHSVYSEMGINGTPTINTTFVAAMRQRFDDNRTGGGNKPLVWATYQGTGDKTGLYDITNCSSGFTGFNNAPCYATFWGDRNAVLSSDEDETGVLYDAFAGGTQDAGNHALNATGNVFHALVQVSTGNRFVNSRGFTSEDFGTGAGYFNFYSQGVNASGAASGFNAFQGPTVFGNLTHAAAGVQVDVEGGSFTQSMTSTATSGTVNGNTMTLTLNPGATDSGVANALNVTTTFNSAQAFSGRIRGIINNFIPTATSGTVTRVEGFNNATIPGGTAPYSLVIGTYADTEMLTTAGTTAALQGIRCQSGQATAGGTITQDDCIVIQAPTLAGTLTHHAGIHINSGQSTGANNSDGWAIKEDGAADKNQFGTVSVLTSTQSPAFINGGVKYTFSANACSATTTVGGASAGSFVSGTTGTCTVTILMGSSATAPNGWHCTFEDHTTPANFLSQTGAADTTHCSMTGTTVSGDLITFAAFAY